MYKVSISRYKFAFCVFGQSDCPTVPDDSQPGVSTTIDDVDHKDGLTADDSVEPEEAMDRLTTDEVVNCICQLNEENGLMIQVGITARILKQKHLNPKLKRIGSIWRHKFAV